MIRFTLPRVRGRLGLPLALGLLAVPATASAQASQLTPIGSTVAAITDCDDCNTTVSLTDVFPSGVNFGGTVYTEMYVGTNGYVTFGHGSSSYSPLGIPGYTAGPIVAGQFDDLDPGKGGDVHYTQNAGGGWVAVTYSSVHPYSTPTGAGSGGTTFQIVLREASSGSQDFQIELRYNDVGWARSGNISSWPTAGWSTGDGSTYGEVGVSGQSNFRDVESGSNIGVAGVYRWDVEGGVVAAPPTVTATASVTSITATSAETGGAIGSDGGSSVTARGVAWSTSSGPTTADETVSAGSGTGTFSASLSGLTPGATYYVRAWATNAEGTGYGPERTFTTLSQVPPSVTTAGPTDVTHESAAVGGEVTSDGGATVTSRGIAYATTSAPTTGDAVVVSGSGTGSFAAALSGLDAATTYYVRAWATNSEGTSYGSERSFTTEKLPQTVSFARLGDLMWGDASVELVASATSGLDVSFSTDEPDVAVVTDGRLVPTGAGTVTVTAAQTGDELWAAAEPVERTLEIAPRPVEGRFSVPDSKLYDATDTAVVLERSLVGVLDGDVGQVFLDGGTAHYDTPDVGGDKPVTLAGAALAGPRADEYTFGGIPTVRAAIVPGPADHVSLYGPARVRAGIDEVELLLAVRDSFGNITRVEESTVFSLDSDTGYGPGIFRTGASATLDGGRRSIAVRLDGSLLDVGQHTFTASRVSGEPLAGGAIGVYRMEVVPGDAMTFRIEADGGGDIGVQTVGTPFGVRITAIGPSGAVATDFDGWVRLSTSEGSGGATGGTTARFSAGVLAAHQVSMSEAGRFTLVVTSEDGAATGRSEPFEVIGPTGEVDVELSLDDPRPAPGSVVTIEVVVTNRGASAAQGVVVGDPLAGQDRLTTVDVVSEVGRVDAATGAWHIERLDPGERVVLLIRARVAASGSTSSIESGEDR